jgi:mRNA-degrading endonuclease RelE of RelBE toxin-antitoxin system
MDIIIEKQARKVLLKMPKKVATIIFDKINGFANNPEMVHADIKKMIGTDNSYRLRQGDWRVIMVKTNDCLIVETIGTRGDVYK